MSQSVADSVRHLPRVAINDTYQLARDADVIYASDAKWWKQHPAAIECRGIKATVELVRGKPSSVPDEVLSLRNTGPAGFDSIPGNVRTHANSGSVGIQIAIHAGAARVLLLGFDMHGKHWHPQHERPLGNPGAALFGKWLAYMNGFAREIAHLPVDVVNCTPGSALRCFRQSTIESALDQREAA